MRLEKVMFYILCLIFFYNGITENITMIERSFKGIVILGFINVFNDLDKLNRR